MLMENAEKLLSIVVACYNEEQTIGRFYEEVRRVEPELSGLALEFIFVDDGSSDSTLRILRDLRKQDERVHYRSLSRNFGKEAALYAGMQAAKGDYVVTMDVDLQDPPALLPRMFSYLAEGYDCVATRRTSRKGEPWFRSFCARMFYRIMNRISKTDMRDGARDYRLMTRQVADAILSMKEYNRFLKGIYGWVGFRTMWLDYENVERSAGKSKWSFFKLLRYSIEGMVAFSTAPLVAVSAIGMALCVTALVFLVVIFVRALLVGDPVAGWPSMMCVITLLGGIQLMCLGIVGMYLAKAYLETKDRPIYIVKEEE